MMKKIMKRAHKLAKKMIGDYAARLALALRTIWKEIKSKMKTNKWKTAKGAEIVMTTEHITEDTINADGHKVTVKADWIYIKEVTVNGKEHQARLTRHHDKPVLDIGTKTIEGKQHPLLVLIPEDIYQDVWGEYDARRAAAIEAEIKAEREYQDHYNKVRNAMGE